MRRISLSILSVLFMAALAAPSLGAQSAAPVRRLAVEYSKAFTVEYHEGWKLVTVSSPWPGSTTSFRYVLYPRGGAKPAGAAVPKDARLIQTPVSRVVSFSTSYLPAIEAIGQVPSIVGVDTTAFVYSPAIRARVEAGAIVETTKNWMPDIERMISLSPDAVFTYGMGNEWDSHPKLLEAGLPVIIDGEWAEADPLARAEWIKFIAAFYDKESEASAYFDKVVAEYKRIKALAAAAPGPRPKVLTNGPFQGSWSVSGGNSFMARLIADAGGSYLWADDKSTGGLVLSIEAVYARALGADVWLNPALEPTKLADVTALDPRFAELPVVKKGEVWNNNQRVNASGGNDYFESAVINPDRVLADLVKLLRPGLLADRPFTWYRKLAK
jgi:iron complex transport system substrate-binding protein